MSLRIGIWVTTSPTWEAQPFVQASTFPHLINSSLEHIRTVQSNEKKTLHYEANMRVLEGRQGEGRSQV